MGTIAGVSLQTILLFVAIIVTQIMGGTMLPKTDAFRDIPWTTACLGTYILSFWMMALAISRGVPLSMMLPIMAALVPLAMVGIGVWLYGEPASFAKIAWLIGACGAIGIASAVK